MGYLRASMLGAALGGRPPPRAALRAASLGRVLSFGKRVSHAWDVRHGGAAPRRAEWGTVQRAGEQCQQSCKHIR
jgi:hypothetical protein